MTRSEVLQKAEEAVNGSREQDYGTPERNFTMIADLWSIYLNQSVTAVDVAMMMALLKVSRIKNGGGSGDSFVDLAGYAACGGELAERNHIMSGEEIARMIAGIPEDSAELSQDEVNQLLKG